MADFRQKLFRVKLFILPTRRDKKESGFPAPKASPDCNPCRESDETARHCLDKAFPRDRRALKQLRQIFTMSASAVFDAFMTHSLGDRQPASSPPIQSGRAALECLRISTARISDFRYRRTVYNINADISTLAATFYVFLFARVLRFHRNGLRKST